MNSAATAFQWLVGWLVVIFILIAINRTVIGNKIVYYALWLGVLFVLVTQYRVFADLLGSNSSTVGAGEKAA